MRKKVLCLITSLLVFAGTFFNSTYAVSANASEINTAGANEINNEQQDEDIIYNSVALLNYFVVLSQEVVSSKNSRIQLERISDEVFNNIEYKVIDKDTQAYIEDLQKNIPLLTVVSLRRILCFLHFYRNPRIAGSEFSPVPVHTPFLPVCAGIPHRKVRPFL